MRLLLAIRTAEHAGYVHRRFNLARPLMMLNCCSESALLPGWRFIANLYH